MKITVSNKNKVGRVAKIPDLILSEYRACMQDNGLGQYVHHSLLAACSRYDLDRFFPGFIFIDMRVGLGLEDKACLIAAADIQTHLVPLQNSSTVGGQLNFHILCMQAGFKQAQRNPAHHSGDPGF